MPYKKEIASGDSLIWLENSTALKDFKGVIRHKEEGEGFTPPPMIEPLRREWWPRRVIAVDGSNIVARGNNGFPGTELGLLLISVVAIKLEMLQDIESGAIPRPSIFHDMEKVGTVDAALPGIGIVHRDADDGDPVDFFREIVFETLSNKLTENHETLLGTLHAISQDCRKSAP